MAVDYSGYNTATGQKTGGDVATVPQVEPDNGWRTNYNDMPADILAEWQKAPGEWTRGANGQDYKMGPDGRVRYRSGELVPLNDDGTPDTHKLDLSHEAAHNLSLTSIAEGDYTPGTLVSDVYDWAMPEGVKDAVSGITGGGSGGGSGGGAYDAAGELAKSEEMAGNVYKKALENYDALAANRAPTGQISAPDAVQAQQIGTPSTLSGQEAADLRAQRLQQAQDAANSPSAAAAQMRGNLGQITQAQMGQANMARGADRASARRDAMLATGTQGMQAANQSAALAATEQAQKQQALTGALSGVQASDVGAAQALTQIGAQNQQANLQAGQFNTTAGMQAQSQSAANALAGWQAQQGAQNAALGTGLQATGAQNQAQGTAAGYATGVNQANMQKTGALIGAGGAALGALLSDEEAKSDVGSIAGEMPKHEPDDFLDWQYKAPTAPAKKGLVESILSDERAKYNISRPKSTSDKATEHLQNAFGLSDERVKLDVSTAPGSGPIFDDFAERTRGMSTKDAASLLSSYENLSQSPTMQPTAHNRTWADFRGMNREQDFDTMMQKYLGLKRAEENARGGLAMNDTTLSDERAKAEVDQMGEADLVDFADRVPLATYRYKPGVPGADDGEDYHAGTLAQSLENTGPLGRLMVHERPDGLKEVEYGPLGLAVGKGALAEAKDAKAIAQAALAKASGKRGR